MSRTVRIAFAILFGLAILLAAYVVWPFRGPLFLALVLASVLHGVHAWVVRLVGGRRITGAALTTAGLLVVIVGPVAATVGFVAGQIVSGLAFVRDQLGIRMVARALAIFHLSPAHIQDVVVYAADAAGKAAQRALEGSPRVLFHTALMLIAFYFFLLEGRKILHWMERLSPLQARQTQDLIAEFRSVSRASILGAALAALFQGLATTVGFLLVGVPNAVFFGALTMAASFIPVVGTLAVWLPAVAFLWLFGHHGASIVLLWWCLLLVVGAEQVGKPFLLRALRHGGETMHTGLVFLSLLGGIEMFGPMGLVIGPLLIAFFLAMVRIYERDFSSTKEPDHDAGDAMSELRVRALDEGELDGAEELLTGKLPANEARASLARLGGVDDKSLQFGDGWAASVEIDGTTVLVRGEPAEAHWTVYGQPGIESGKHAARRLLALLGEEAQR